MVQGGAAVGADELTLFVAEGPDPVGDLQPTVTVADPAQITDASANAARNGIFGGTVDGVRPALVDGAPGEETAGGACEQAPVDGSVDCFRADWSELVVQPSTHTVFSSSPRPSLEVMSGAPAPYTDVRVDEAPAPDRDATGELQYTGGGGVTDARGNPAIASGPIAMPPACVDPGVEPNDSRLPGNPSMNSSGYNTEQYLCAADPDWYRVTASGGGEVHVRVDPSQALQVTATLWDGAAPVVSATGSGPGAAVDLVATGLVAGGGYWVQITAGETQEGPYCADPLPLPGEDCLDGDDTPQ